MKRKKLEHYEAGYSREDFLKKCAVGAALVGGLVGGLTGCGQDMSYAGDVPYIDPDAPSSCVSASDAKSDGQLPYDGKIAVSSEDEEAFQLDGDVVCVPQDGDSK